MSNIIIIRPSDKIETLPVESVELETLQEIVGGYIVTVPCIWSEEFVIVVNEEGKIKRLPKNRIATKIAATTGIIVGDVALVEVDGEDLVGFTNNRSECIIHNLERRGAKYGGESA